MGATHRDENAAPLTLGEAVQERMMPIPQDAKALFLRAHPTTLQHVRGLTTWTCVQSLRPVAQQLEADGWAVLQDTSTLASGAFDLTLVLPPRQRDEARACLAQALQLTRPGGVVAAAMPNTGGARSGERDLEQLAGTVHHASRNKCRVFWCEANTARIDRERVVEWSSLDAVRPILDGRYISRPGLFAWDRIDPASTLLAEHLPATLKGRVADLGAGYGYLSTQLLHRCPAVTALDLYEAEARALEPARRNLERARRDTGHAAEVTLHWHDVAQGLPARYDAVISNPPFHHGQGRADRPELGQAFIRAAAAALKPRGMLWMVANRHLPYEATLAQWFGSVRMVAERDGFKVIAASDVVGGRT